MMRAKRDAIVEMDHEAVDLEIGRRLRARRNLCSLSMGQIGDLLGLSYQQVQKYESGENSLSVSRLMQYCRALKISPAMLLKEIALTIEIPVPAEADMNLDVLAGEFAE